jgi:hypothetical protein
MMQNIHDFFFKHPSESFDRILIVFTLILGIMFLLLESIISSWTLTFGELLTAIIGGFAPILIFMWGIRSEKRKVREREIKDYLGIITVVIDAVTQLKFEVAKQKDNYLSFARAIQLDGERGVPMHPFAISSHAHILQMSYQSIFLAFNEIFFVSNEGNDNAKEVFSKFWKRIWFIKNSMEGYDSVVKEFILESKEYQNKFQNTLTTINTMTGNFATSIQKMTIGSAEYQARFAGVDNEIFLDFVHTLDSINHQLKQRVLPPTTINEEYLSPLLNLYNTPKFYEVHRNGEIAVLIIKAKNEYLNLKNVYESRRTSAEAYAAECDKISDDFESFISCFSSILNKVKYKLT